MKKNARDDITQNYIIIQDHDTPKVEKYNLIDYIVGGIKTFQYALNTYYDFIYNGDDDQVYNEKIKEQFNQFRQYTE